MSSMSSNRVFSLVLLAFLLMIFLLGCTPRPQTWPPPPTGDSPDLSWHIDVAHFQNSAHGNLSCETCHPDISTTDDEHPTTENLLLETTALYDYSRCATCHPEEYTDYEQGVHAEARANPEAVHSDAPTPTCGDCHDAHYVTTASRTELLANVNETCRRCHPEEAESYEHNYHGKAAILGYEQTATCTDCHGAHKVHALLDDRDAALAACTRCHPQANTQMASFTVHARETLDVAPDDPNASNYVLFFWVKLFFTVLVVSVLTFFYTHTGLWFLRSLHERLKGEHHDH